MRRMAMMAAAVACLCAGLSAEAQSLATEDLRIPMVAAGPQGLEAVLVKPGGPGRYPLVIVEHGSPRDAAARPGMTARGMMPQLTEFARRGFVAAAVLRRGYGTSPGGWAETFGPCNRTDYAAAGRAGAADLRASIEALSKRPDVDPSRILAVGVSAGGFATVALTADPPPGLIAGISFAGGRGSSGPDQVCEADELVGAFGSFGARSRVPMLWVYAQNDRFFGPALARRLFDAFRGAGGQATFVEAPAFGSDGHGLFSAAGRSLWTPIVDRFLARQGLAGAVAPAVSAPRLQPPPQLGAGGRQDFQSFLDAPSHKAFAVGPKGAYAWRSGRATLAEASDVALRRCEELGHRPCRLFAVDDTYAP